MNTAISKWNNSNGYDDQTNIIRRALESPDHALNELLRLMRLGGRPAIYLSGTRLDHDFCFGSLDVGVLFSVLPEDPHAAVPGYHPHSTETYVTFQGALVMEYLEDGHLREKTVGGNEVLVIPPGQCHRVRRAPTSAASLIVKTNLGAEPKVERCETCRYHADPTACLLNQSWRSESHPTS